MRDSAVQTYTTVAVLISWDSLNDMVAEEFQVKWYRRPIIGILHMYPSFVAQEPCCVYFIVSYVLSACEERENVACSNRLRRTLFTDLSSNMIVHFV